MSLEAPRRPQADAARASWALCAGTEVPPGDEWLGERERALLARLRFPKRRFDWRLGRWTAKRALVRSLGREGAALPLDHIEVLAAADGAPETHIAGVAAAPALALSHSGELGFALACLPPRPLGCDVERVEARSPEFLRDYLTPAESSLVVATMPEARPLLATLLWSAKESALKLLRQGLRADTRSVEVRPASDVTAGRRGRFVVETGERVPLRGCWWLAGEYVCTVVLAAAEDPGAWEAPDESQDWSLSGT